MSLMKLLTVGQSLRGITNDPSPYKITEQHLLPKFAPVGRPVSLAPPKDRVVKPALVRSGARALPASPLEVNPVSLVPKEQAASGKEVKRPGSVRNEGAGWRGFFSFASRSKSRARRPLVQGEMTLETLKVVRNDLNEADLEVVPAKLEPSPEPVPAVSEVSAASSVWSRAAAHFSNVTRLWL